VCAWTCVLREQERERGIQTEKASLPSNFECVLQMIFSRVCACACVCICICVCWHVCVWERKSVTVHLCANVDISDLLSYVVDMSLLKKSISEKHLTCGCVRV